MLFDALRIASIRVSKSIANILLFRNVYYLTRLLFGGFWGFIATVYLTGKIRRKIRQSYERVNERRARELGEKRFKFDETSLQSIDLDQDASVLSKFNEYVQKNSELDLFNCLFSVSSDSVLISLLTILGIEQLNSKYEISLVLSIFYVVTVSFLLCFGSSFKYTQMLIPEWLTDFKTMLADIQSAADKKKEHGDGHSRQKRILITHTNPFDKSVEYVGLWLSKYDSHRNASKVEIRFMTPNYTDYIDDVFSYYSKHHMTLEKVHETESELLPGEKHNKVEKYDLYVQDYYNGGGMSKLFEKRAKDLGFTSEESWTEFRLFPGVNFDITVFQNTGKQKKKKSE